jgi:hypothetical protein
MGKESGKFRLGKDFGYTLGGLLFLSIFYFILRLTNKLPNWFPYEVVIFLVSIIFLYRVAKNE